MTYCAEPHCSALVESGRCPAHTRARRARRESRHEQGYGNRWARRARLFRARYPLCGMRPDGQRPVMSACFDAGRVTLGACVDHVEPHRGDPARMWDELGNWQTLCASCHTRKTGAGL